MVTKQTVIAAMIGAGIIALAWILVGLLGTDVPTVRGKLRVSYKIQTSPTSSSGATHEGIAALEFHAGYVVMKDARGNGRVLFPQNTRELEWGR